MTPKNLERSCHIYSSIWSSKNDLKPEEVAISSSKKYWFDCHNCGHNYQQSTDNKTKGKGCPFCSGHKICGNCEICLSKSCNIYSSIWSSKNELKPEEVAISSGTKYWFDCPVCSHEYKQSPAKKTNGRGCPYCSNKKRCGKCELCLQKSCNIYTDIWSSKNEHKSEEVAISCNKKYWFDCKICCHDYHQRPGDKTQGYGCPTCVNKTERKVADYLKEIDVKFKKEFKIDSNKRYDFLLQDYKLLIEVDGDQHFRQISNWQSCEENIENDIRKMKVAIENGYSILRIYQPDIFGDKIEWKKCISDNLYLRVIPAITCKSSAPYMYNRHSQDFNK